jgi:hypothetical protein
MDPAQGLSSSAEIAAAIAGFAGTAAAGGLRNRARHGRDDR